MKPLSVILLLLCSAFAASAQTWTPQSSGTSNILQSVWFTNQQNGWAVGDVGALIVTTNGGQTWSNVFLTTQDLEDVAFADANTGVIVGDDGLILRTVTAGVSWSVATSGTGVNLRTVAFGDGGMAYIGGRDGVILRSPDNGASWQLMESGTVRYRGSAARGQHHAWIVGELGVIRATTNGGATWFPQTSGTGSDLHCVFFLNTLEGWAGGQNDMVLYTNNGGSTWVLRNIGINRGIDAIFFINSNEGWAVGDGGAIFRTTNSGINWFAEVSGTTNGLNDVFFTVGGAGWAVGDGGTIVHRTPPTSVRAAEELPLRPILNQNYPNPFNPTTSITYALTNGGQVTLLIHNLIGQEVARLVNASQEAGTYTVGLDATNLPSGVYLYRLTVDGVPGEMRKMILAR